MSLAEDNLDDRYEVLPSFRFTLMVEGGEEVPLKSVKPFQKENEFEFIEEGGMNDYVRIKRKHATKPHTIQVERYVNEDFYDPIPNGGAEFVLPLLLFVGGNHAGKFGWVGAERVFVFFGSTVMNREMGGFDSEKSGLLTETITIAYNQLYSMDIPGDSVLEPWKFANGIANSYANPGWMAKIEANNTKKVAWVQQAEERAWYFGKDETEYTGVGKRHANEDTKLKQNGVTESTLKSRAAKDTWHFGTDAEEYQGKFGARHYEDEEKKFGQLGKNLVKKSSLARKAKGETWHFGESPDDYKGNEKLHAADGQPTIPQNRVEKQQLAREATANTYHMSDGVKGDLDLPDLMSKADAETWRFTNAETAAGNGKTHPAGGEGISQNSVEKSQLVSMAEGAQWPKQQHADTRDAAAKESLETQASGNTWAFGQSAGEYEGNGQFHANHIEGEPALEELEKAAAGNQWPAAHHANTSPDGQVPTDKKTLESQAANNTWPKASHATKVPGSKEAMLKK